MSIIEIRTEPVKNFGRITKIPQLPLSLALNNHLYQIQV